jgi:hypothetical protein
MTSKKVFRKNSKKVLTNYTEYDIIIMSKGTNKKKRGKANEKVVSHYRGKQQGISQLLSQGNGKVKGKVRLFVFSYATAQSGGCACQSPN